MRRLLIPAVICLFFSLVGFAQAKQVFGIESFASSLTNEQKEPVTQAGAHPYALTATFPFTHKVIEEEYFPELKEFIPTVVTSPGEPKNVAVDLPRGVVVDPLATPRCKESELESATCPNESAVGFLLIHVKGYPYRPSAALYNMVAPEGVPGQFAANFVGLGITVHIDGRLDSEGDYNLSGEASSLELQYPIYAIETTFWGNPSDPSHNLQRGECLEKEGHPECPVPPTETAFLTMPTACAGQPLVSSLRVDDWKESSVYDSALSQSPVVSGCNGLSPFEPEIKATPENAERGAPLAPVKSSDSPAGLNFGLHIRQTPPADRPGDPVDCSPGSWQNNPTAFAYRWLRNGVPIAGATSSTYVITQADTGALLQCEVIASGAGVGPGFAASVPLPTTTPLTSVTPTTSVTAEENGKPIIKNGEPVIVHTVPATGGAVDCEPGAWGASPVFAYRWFKNGSELAGQTAGSYVVAAGETPLSLQCEVIATSASGTAVAFSADVGSEPALTPALPSFTDAPRPSYPESDYPLATPNLDNAVVTLPPGLTANPSFAEGLEGCTPAQIGLKAPADERQAIVLPAGTKTFTLGFGGQSTPALAALPVNPSTAEIEKAREAVQEALEALPGIGAGNVSVSADSGNWEVTFEGALAGREVGSLGGEALIPAVQPLTASTMQTGGSLLFSEKVENPKTQSLEYTACPHPSKIGNVEVKTPLLEKPLPGSVYLARPFDNVPSFGDAAHPGGSLLALYLVVEDPERGIVVKLAGHVEVGGEEGGGGAGLQPGQIRTTFDENPQLPVEDVKFHSELPETDHEGLFGGTRAPLTTPPTCGSYQTSSELTPWSAPESGPAATPSSLFEITEGPHGSACAHTPSEEPNSPSFSVGTLSPVAGSYSPVAIHVAREDGSQRIVSVSGTAPPGLLGKLAGIEKCPQADIEAAERRSGEGEGRLEQEDPSCPSGSEVATFNVGVGSGAPFYVKAKGYLAGPWEGAPFSAVVITPAVAGPFDLGVVVTRVGIYINPSTVQVTLAGDHLPTVLHGIPVDIRSVSGVIDRSGFTLNPTSCEEMHTTASVQGEGGGVANLSSPFQAQGCGNLPFKPQLTAAAGGHGSKAGGTSLKIAVTSAGVGQANIAKVHFQFPKELSSRLTTLQKACTEKAFNADPASCDPDSVIGHAIVHIPLLESPLIGPIYLVSHGGAAFPDVEVVLQGEGVTAILDGKTSIKNGITYNYFESIPDVPFYSFEAELPSGPDSVFTPNVSAQEKYSLCAQTLTMPIEMTGQNGAVLRQNVKIAPTGCANALRLVSKKLGPAGKTLTLSVEVPAAGKLTASGRGLKRTSKTTSARQIVSLSISLAKAGAAKIAKHKTVKVKVTLAFAPASGKQLTTSVAATYKGKAAKKGSKR